MGNSYIYPPKFIGGSLYKGDNTEYVQGKILQLLAINRNELVFDMFYGTPLILFNSISSISADAARLQTILQTSIPEASFRVAASIIEDGLINLIVYWSYQNQDNSLNFNINY